MKLKGLLISIFLLIFCINFSYAQESGKEKKEKSSITKEDKKEKAALAKKEKKEKAALAKETKKSAKETSTTEDEDNEGGDDKNFGPIFDGASISLSAGMNVYFGDIAAYNLFPRPSQFGDHVTGAFKFSIARDIKWGLGAKFNYQRGSLEGTRKTGKNSSVKSFRNRFYDVSLQVRYLLSDALFKKNKDGRFKLYSHIGVGSMWYRTQLFDTETLNTKDYEGYIEVENSQGLAQKTLSDKTAKARTWTIPYGVTLIYRYNHKMDFHLDFTQSATFTDRLDAFERDWTAKDKYDYIGIGITYNFNRTSADAPKKRKKKTAIKDAYSDDESTSDNSGDIKKKLLGKKRRLKKSKSDELLELRLKLFETQLLLFEMQYLMK
ncbi:MAG: hypothetical protein JKX68_13980 [Flavobacteriales bacterium]|nr:hypothetical protein [Flavobacteriales bacterium]